MGLSDRLEMVQLPLISNEQCMEWYNRWVHCVTFLNPSRMKINLQGLKNSPFRSGSRQLIPRHTFLCAGWEEGAKDACGGDSGGPLVVYRPDGRAELVGLPSCLATTHQLL